MKKYWIILFGLYLSLQTPAQFRSAGVVFGAGITIVDVEKAIQTYNLSDWDNIGVIVKAAGEYELKPGLFAVGELGANRLYYWEYPYSDGFNSYVRWRSEWTYNLGISFKKMLTTELFLQAGPAVHIFEDGSGTVLGLLLTLGYDLSVTENIKIPIGARIEPVFGNAIPTSILLNSGVRYEF